MFESHDELDLPDPGEAFRSQSATDSAPAPQLPKVPSPIDGNDLLERLVAALRKHVFLSTEQAVAVALWVLSTWVVDTATFAPRLGITSAEKQCGKTTLLDVLQLLVSQPLESGSISAAAIFRSIDAAKMPPTLLIDEADTFLASREELIGVLNQGHRRGGKVTKCVGADWTPKQFVVFAPAAIACIGNLPPTLEDRSIKILMRRATREEKPAPLRTRQRGELTLVMKDCQTWAIENRKALLATEVVIPEWLANREADNWEPMFAIAGVVGGDWPERTEHAARTLLETDREASMSNGVRLLADLRTLFHEKRQAKISSQDLCNALNRQEESPWSELKSGRGLDPVGLAALLKPYKIKPHNVRIGTATPKGYDVEQFNDAFRRYLPPEEAPHRHIGEIP